MEEKPWTLLGLFNKKISIKFSEAVAQRCSAKKVLLKVSQNSRENICVGFSFFNKTAGLRPATLHKKRLRHWCFPVNFAKFYRTSPSLNFSLPIAFLSI